MMCLSVLSDMCDGVEPLMSKSLPAMMVLPMADGRRAHTQLFIIRPGELGWDWGAEVNFSDLDVICQEWLGV